MDRNRDMELYVHIPFCVQKCNYCDFLSAPAGEQVQNAYMEALLTEIRARGEEVRQDGGRPVASVFIGGGTPSAIAPLWIERLMETVRESFSLTEDAEISMEMNPGTVGREAFTVYRRAGINRLSIGCQSANDGELGRLGRIHDFRQFLETYRQAREAGFSNINVDLMGALPGQDREDNIRNVRMILNLDPAPEHISAYSLIVEEGTPFYELWRKGELALPDEELERMMYWDTAELLAQAGYEHYEISNYARPGFACMHNLGYWRRRDYLGVGLGAASLFNNERYSNCRDLKEYLRNPLEGRIDRHFLSREECMEETMFLGLRTMTGVAPDDFRAQFGVGMEEVYRSVIEEGIGEELLAYRDMPSCEHAAGGGCRRLVLTRRGIDLSNYIMAKFLL